MFNWLVQCSGRHIVPCLKRKRATRGLPVFSYVDFAAPSGRVADQFRLREVLRDRDAPPEEPDDLGGDCTRGLGERLTDGAGERYVGVVLL